VARSAASPRRPASRPGGQRSDVDEHDVRDLTGENARLDPGPRRDALLRVDGPLGHPTEGVLEERARDRHPRKAAADANANVEKAEVRCRAGCRRTTLPLAADLDQVPGYRTGGCRNATRRVNREGGRKPLRRARPPRDPTITAGARGAR